MVQWPHILWAGLHAISTRTSTPTRLVRQLARKVQHAACSAWQMYHVKALKKQIQTLQSCQRAECTYCHEQPHDI